MLELLMIAATAAFLYPLYAVIMVALKTPEDLAFSPMSLPSPFSFANISTAWDQAGMAGALKGSVVLVLISTSLQVALGAPAGYVLARRKTRLSTGLYILFIFGLILPPQLGLIPLYQTMHDLHLLGNYISLILVYAGGLLPFTVFLFTGFIRALPTEYEYAALADGATRLQSFVLIVLPLLRPIIGTVIILNAITVWNDFLTPLLYLGGSDFTTVPIAIFSFVGQYSTQWNLLFAAMLVGVLPMLLAFMLLQRFVIRGFVPGLK